MIPKILHFTWKTHDLPRVMARYFDEWKRLHPNWEVRLWTDASMRDFVAATYPDFLAVYDGYPRMIQRADAFRYLVLNHFGGVYADLDVEPLQPIDGLLELPGFVGVEPIEHMGTDRTHAGLPFQFTNAFMGAPAGHPLFELIIELLPQLADQAVFFSTGPAMVTAAVLRLFTAERPALLLPAVWSPLRDGGLPTRGDARLRDVLGGLGTIIAAENGALVSHKWLTTWVKWHERYTPLQEIGQLPSRIKWWIRRKLLHPELGAVKIASPLRIYADQQSGPGEPMCNLTVAIRLDGDAPLDPALAAAISELDYPADKLSFVIDSGARGDVARAAVRASIAKALSGSVVVFSGDNFGDEVGQRARANNRLLERAAVGDKILLIGGNVRRIPADAVKRLLAVQRPVVAANLGNAAGEADITVFRYSWGPDFRILYKLNGLSGLVRRDRSYRALPADQRAFPLVALDGVGDDFVLIDHQVIAAGVRFAESSYKLHRNGEAFGIMARDLGFEPAALTGLMVDTL